MFDKLVRVEERFNELERALSQPGLNGQELTRLSKERAELEEVVEVFRQFKRVQGDKEAAREMLEEKDADLRAMAKEELQIAEQTLEELNQKLLLMTLPKDPNDGRNVIVEVRAGTGGDEAAIFAGDLFRMYMRFAETMGWRAELMSATPADMGGYREVIATISGNMVYSLMKFESGVHRVQRVPVTESQGRIHTSACTVAILPEVDAVEVDINPNDLEISLCRASGAGGQHVNTTDSAVRIVHRPTGIVVECQDERSQHKNKERAMKVLHARIYEKAQQERSAAISADRKSQVGSGDRSERIRTYNFPQGRVTDHRIGLTLYNLADFIQGDIMKVLDGLRADHQAKLLQQQDEPSL